VGDVAYEYDEQFQQTEVRYKDGRRIRRTFDEQGLLTSREVTSTDQDAENASNTWMKFVYDPATRRPTQMIRPSVNPNGSHLTTLTYTPGGQPQQITESGWEPKGETFVAIHRTTTLAYDAQGRLQAIDGPREDVDDTTRLTYDTDGRLRELIGPKGQTQRILSYDAYGRPLQIESHGQLTSLSYNVRGEITALSRNQQTTRYEYSATGQVTKIIQPDGQFHTYAYDDANRQVRVSDTEGNQLQWVFDTEDRMTEQRFSTGDGGVLQTLGYLYDVEGRLAQLKKNDSTFDVVYKDYNRLINLENTAGGSIQAAYNPFGQLLGLSQAGHTSAYQYNVKNQLSGITDARGNNTSYQRDDFGRVVTRISPDSGTTQYQYDNANNIRALIVATGDESRYQYDASNRLINVTRPDGEYAIGYTEQSRLARIQGPHEITEYDYTPEGWLSQHSRVIDQHRFSTRYEYSTTGQLTRKHLANGQTLRYHYYQEGPHIGQLRAVMQEGFFGQQPIIAELNSGLNSTEQRQTFGNGIVQTQRRNAQGQLISIDHDNALKLKYSYNNAGQITGIDWQNPFEQHEDHFSYQRLGQLRTATTLQGEHYYHYDNAGNRLMAEGDDKIQVALYAENSNRLEGQAEAIIGDLVENNAAGSPIKIGARRYEYNSEQRPVKLFIHDQLKAEYAYNSWGERIKKVVYSGHQKTVTYYLYDGQKLVAEANEDGQIQQQYLYYQDQPVAILKDGEIYAIHTDHLGTPRSVTNADQQTVWTANYEAFGKAVTQEDPDQDGDRFELNLRFPGQYADAESGTYYNYRRDYDPETGRYLTSDPIGQAGGINTYLYAQGNPIVMTDPLGLSPDGSSGSPLSDPLPNLAQPVATTGVNGGTGVVGMSPAATLAETNAMVGQFAVYTYPGCNTNSAEGLAAFNAGINYLTTNVSEDQKVTTLHGKTLSVIAYNGLLTEQYNQGELTEPQFQARRWLDVPFTVKDDPACTLFIWYCSNQDRESNEFALMGDNLSATTALANAIGAIDSFYANPEITSVLPAISGGNQGTVLVISAGATSADIRKEVESLLGTKLVTTQDMDELIAAIEKGRDAGAPALVNIEALYTTVLNRFYDEMFDRTSTEYERYTTASEAFNKTADLCIPEIEVPPPCEKSAEQVEWEVSQSKYESALKAVREKLIEEGYYPRHEFDLEEDAFRNGVIFDVSLAILTGDLSLAVKGMQLTVKAAVEKAVVSLGVKFESKAAKAAFTNAVERFVNKQKAKLSTGTCSFDGATLVKTSQGFLPIRDLRTEDRVWSRDERSGQSGFKVVLAQYSNPYKETVSVTVRDGEIGLEQTIVSNRIHPYFVQLPAASNTVASSEGHVYQGEITNGAWVDAANLKAGYRLLNDDSTWAEVVSVKIELKPLQAFNLTVADYHTYFVAANDEADAVWVHNSCYHSVPEGYNPIAEKTEYGQDQWKNANGDVVYRGHNGKFYDLVHAPTARTVVGVPNSPPTFRSDFDTHVAKVDIDPNTGHYAIDKKGSIKGGHNALEFEKALKNPLGDGVEAQVLNRTSITDSSGQVIGQRIQYRVPRREGNGPNAGESAKDQDGNILYKPEQTKTVYDPNVISDSAMIEQLKDVGGEAFNNKVGDFIASGNSNFNFPYSKNGLDYFVYLKKDVDGKPYIDNIHLE
jgi:RHS repeat-associated protein